MKLLLANDKSLKLEQENLYQFEMLRKAQADILQAQITPHFLYNTLQSIQMMVLMETGNIHSPSGDAVLMLSDMLRYVANRNEDNVPLQKEIDYLEQYLHLKKLSYPDRLNIEISITDDARSFSVPKIVLQPLVENIMVHGMPDSGKCIIRICAYVKEQILFLCVEDNGPGMKSEQMDEFNRLSNQDVILPSQHIGLINIAQRLKLLYGENAFLHLSNSELGGLCVLMQIPSSEKITAKKGNNQTKNHELIAISKWTLDNYP